MSVYLVDLVCTLLTVTSFAILLVFLMTLWLVENTSFSSFFLRVVLIKINYHWWPSFESWNLPYSLFFGLKEKPKQNFFSFKSWPVLFFFSDFLRISCFWPDSLVSCSYRMEIYTKRSQKSSKKKRKIFFQNADGGWEKVK